jgi:hypothetical protein
MLVRIGQLCVSKHIAQRSVATEEIAIRCLAHLGKTFVRMVMVNRWARGQAQNGASQAPGAVAFLDHEAQEAIPIVFQMSDRKVD